MVSSAPRPEGDPSPADSFVTLLSELGITHVVTVPDNTSAPILAALEKPSDPERSRREERVPRVLYATREGEGIGLASGLWLGGGHPAVLIQNTGLLEAGDALRGTAARMGAPILILVTCRGYSKARKAGIEPSGAPMNREILVRSDLDSVAHMTESTLRAWGIPALGLGDATDLTPVREAQIMAKEDERPVAVLLDAVFG